MVSTILFSFFPHLYIYLYKAIAKFFNCLEQFLRERCKYPFSK